METKLIDIDLARRIAVQEQKRERERERDEKLLAVSSFDTDFPDGEAHHPKAEREKG